MSEPSDERDAESAPNAAAHHAMEKTAHSIKSPASNTAPLDQTIESPGTWFGKSLGKYQVTQVLGKGGMGIVLKAHDSVIGRDVAIKVLAEHLAEDATALARFQAEAKAAGQLNHPNVAGIFDVGQQGNSHYLVMEFVTGGSLADRIENRGALSLLEATKALVDACKGIGAAHAAGLIHRDIKPANFLRAADGTVKVADFGLAKVASTKSQQLTQAGTVMGTPFFMSPEQCQAGSVDARSDIYSLGATYYALLTGKNPYHESGSVPQVMYAHCHGKIPDPRAENDSIPPACSRIIAKAMAKAPQDRYQTATGMLQDIEMVNATLSGQTLSMLPSESGSYAQLASVNTQRRSNSAQITAVTVISAVLLIALWWRPWQGSTADPDDSAVATTNATDAAAVPAPLAVEPIKIGILHSLSGTMADSETVIVDAMMFAIGEINDAGGVRGRPLKAVVADGRSEPDVFAQEAERLIVEEQVAVVFGCWTSASRKMVKQIVENHDHLLVYPLQYEGLESSPNIIYMGAAPNQQILPAIQWAFNSLDKRRFYLVGSDYVFPRAANEIIKDELKTLGAEVVGEQYLLLGDSDVESIVANIAETRPDMILNTINGDSNDALFRAIRDAKISSSDCPILSFSIGEAGLRDLNADDINGDYTAWTYFESLDTAENKKFVARFREMYPQRIITDPMETAYASLKLWARAAGELDELDPTSVRRRMLEQRFPSPSGEVRLDPDTQHCYKTPRIGQIQPDGQIKIVWEAPDALQPDPFPGSRTATEWLALLNDLYRGWGNQWSAQ